MCYTLNIRHNVLSQGDARAYAPSADPIKRLMPIYTITHHTNSLGKFCEKYTPNGGCRGAPPKRTKDSTYYTFHYAQILPQRHFARWFENHYARNQ